MPFLPDLFCLAPYTHEAAAGEDLASSTSNLPVGNVNSALPHFLDVHRVSHPQSLGSSFLSDASVGTSSPEPNLASCLIPASASYRPKHALWPDARITAFLQVPGNTTLLGFSLAGAQAGKQLFKAKSTAAQAASATAHSDLHISSHEDFIFGASRKGSRISPDAFNSLTPAYSMMGWFGAMRMSLQSADQSGDGAYDPNYEPTGWTKFIPRALIAFTLFDALNVLVAVSTRHYICDIPLRAWLGLSVLFGLPADGVIKVFSWFMKPRYKIYRLTVNRCRDDMIMPESFEMEDLTLVGEDGTNYIEEIEWTPSKEDNVYTVTFGIPVMVVGYQINTSMRAPPSNDPVDWTLECSNTGFTWELVDQVEGAPIPRQRNSASQFFDALLTVEENAAFRQAYVMEVIFSAGAFVWLVLGTSWVAKASDSCVDSAPPLWLYCYCLVVLTWSFMGTVTTGLIVSAVAMIILGVKAPQ